MQPWPQLAWPCNPSRFAQQLAGVPGINSNSAKSSALGKSRRMQDGGGQVGSQGIGGCRPEFISCWLLPHRNSMPQMFSQR